MYYKKENIFIEEIESLESGKLINKLDESDAKFLLQSRPFNKTPNYQTKEDECKMVKVLPNVFFLLFLTVLSLVFMKFLPTFCVYTKDNSLYADKNSLKYFSAYFGEGPIFVKFIIAILIIALIVKFGCYCSLVDQRISVPELSHLKKTNSLVFLSTITSISCLIILTFFSEKSINFSKNSLFLCENIVYFFFLVSLYTLCSYSNKILNSLEVSGINKDNFYLFSKRICLVFMLISLFSYLLTLLIISYYTPYIEVEKIFMSIFIVCKEINSILFLLFFSFFSLTFKYDFYFLKLNLNVRPAVEFFFDISDVNIKFV